MIKNNLWNYDWFYCIIRITLIIFYPIWLLFNLLESKSWKEFKDGIKIPFQKWGKKNII